MNLEQIDTSTTAGKAEVMRLAAEGRMLAVKLAGTVSWAKIAEVSWDWSTFDYAIISEPVLDRPARVGGRDFPAGSLIQQVIGRAHAEYDRHHHVRDPRDVASDPDGHLIHVKGEPLMAASKRDPDGLDDMYVVMRPDGTAAAVCDTMERARNWTGTGVKIVRYRRADLAGEKG